MTDGGPVVYRLVKAVLTGRDIYWPTRGLSVFKSPLGHFAVEYPPHCHIGRRACPPRRTTAAIQCCGPELAVAPF